MEPGTGDDGKFLFITLPFTWKDEPRTQLVKRPKAQMPKLYLSLKCISSKVCFPTTLPLSGTAYSSAIDSHTVLVNLSRS